MEVISNNKGRPSVHYNGYAYNFARKKREGSDVWLCSRRRSTKCPGSLLSKDGNVVSIREHLCGAPDVERLEIVRHIQIAKKRAREEDTRVISIYSSELGELHNNVYNLEMPSDKTLKRTLYRHRNKVNGPSTAPKNQEVIMDKDLLEMISREMDRKRCKPPSSPCKVKKECTDERYESSIGVQMDDYCPSSGSSQLVLREEPNQSSVQATTKRGNSQRSSPYHSLWKASEKLLKVAKAGARETRDLAGLTVAVLGSAPREEEIKFRMATLGRMAAETAIKFRRLSNVMMKTSRDQSGCGHEKRPQKEVVLSGDRNVETSDFVEEAMCSLCLERASVTDLEPMWARCGHFCHERCSENRSDDSDSESDEDDDCSACENSYDGDGSYLE